MKEIKDYLHLYVGCSATIESHWDDESKVGTSLKITYASLIDHSRKQVVIKPILRPLPSMTGEEGNQFFKIYHKDDSVFYWHNFINVNSAGIEFEFTYQSSNRKRTKIIMFNQIGPEEFSWLLSKGFDLFGLIEFGLAIDKTLTPHNP